jgi:MFS transporter, putative metabolite:H+ symporter
MNASSVNAGARLDRLPLARFHWKILGLISGGALLDAFDVYLAAGVLAAMVKQNFSTLASNAAFISATFFGMLIGSGLAGWAGDRFGRRASYQINLAVFGVASIAACFAPNIETLIGLRFIMGLGLGAELVVAAGTLCEFVPPAYRGRWISLMGLIINSGLLISTSIGYFVIPTLGWRYMFAIAGAGAVVIWLMRKKMPESPRWLESVGRMREAEATLTAIEAEVERQTGKLPPVSGMQTVMARNVPFSVLFTRPVIARTFVAALTCVVINVSVYGFVAWLPTFFVKQGLSVVQSLGFTTLMAFGAPGGAVVGYLLGDRLGRQRGLIVFCAASIVLGFVYPQMRDTTAISIVGFALLTCIYTIVTLGLYGYIPELFPTAFRLRGTGFAGMCGRAASMSTPYVAVALFQNFGVLGVLILVASMQGLLIAALLMLRVETNQQSLEEIETPFDEGVPSLVTAASDH